MGIMDAFSKEDRLELTVSQLIELIDDRAIAESKFNIAMNMCREGLPADTITKVFGGEDNGR